MDTALRRVPAVSSFGRVTYLAFSSQNVERVFALVQHEAEPEEVVVPCRCQVLSLLFTMIDVEERAMMVV